MSCFPKRRLVIYTPMDPNAEARLAEVAKELGRGIHIFTNSASIPSDGNLTSVSNSEEQDEFYEFTAEDYYRLLSTKKDKQLKTRKIREAEEASRRSKISKAIMRVHFPDNYILEAEFHSSDIISSLTDLLKKVIARPDLPFYIYTTPPKQKINDLSKDFHSAGFIPGAIVYFSYDLINGEDEGILISGPFLRDDIMALKDIHLKTVPIEEVIRAEPDTTVPVEVEAPSMPVEAKPATKKPVKPRWLRM
ncbi:hypothetical protein AMTRI_Chr06g177660 [Amborella trichopoda]|uniref:plant UBX domain-containing protein 1 n=1 Tax=Amborella trichopoda TaxID=13333 RepID=UPI0005D3670F|nr:plant UBX domain-containing protein 1 [Amborella trichopoda]|eukprot:XP_011626143.1 plant UBX domain-containing protein 1 [Amborella trichopoda]